MDMPVTELQQIIAGTLAWLGGRFATVVWLAFGALGASILVVLALLPVLPGAYLGRLERRRVSRFLSSDAVFLAVAAAVLLFMRLPFLSQFQLNPDESNLILAARTLLEDPRYWISVEGQSLGPIATIPAMVPGILGYPIDFTTIRIAGIVIWLVALGAMFVGFKRLYPPAMTRVLILPLLLTAISLNYWDYIAFNGEHMPLLLLALAFALHASLQADERGDRSLQSFLLGVVLALVPFAKIQAGPIALVWGLLAIFLSWRIRPKRALHHVGGALFVIVAIAAYLLMSGAWYDFWQSYILNNILYAQVGWNAIHQDTTFFENLRLAPAYFMKPPDSRGLFLLAMVLALFGFVWALLDSRFRTILSGPGVYFALALVAVSFFSVLLPKSNWTHYLLLMFIPVSMFIAAVVAAFAKAVESHAPTGASRSRELAGRGVVIRPFHVALLIALAAYVSAGYNLFEGRKNPATWRGAENLVRGQEPDPVTAAILRHTSPGEPVGHWGVAFEQLAQAGVSLANREAQNERALFPSYQQQYYIDRWIGDVVERRPRIVLDSGAGRFESLRLENYPQAHVEVIARYELVEEVDGFRLFRLEEDSDAGRR